MYGFLSDNEEVLEAVKGLQAYIDEHVEFDDVEDTPQACVCFSPYAAAIELDGEYLWSSEADELDVTAEMLIEVFVERCRRWSKFIPAQEE